MTRHILIAFIFFLVLILKIEAQDQYNKDTSKTSNFKPVETSAEFPGGINALYPFVSKNRQYEYEGDKNKIGIIKVRFVIEKDGSIGDTVTVLQSRSDYYNKEAIRIVKLMPKWKPATLDGKPCKSFFILPIKF